MHSRALQCNVIVQGSWVVRLCRLRIAKLELWLPWAILAAGGFVWCSPGCWGRFYNAGQSVLDQPLNAPYSQSTSG